MTDRRVTKGAPSAFAPGKVILLGEHAVVYGHPAVAAPISRGVTAHGKKSTRARLVIPTRIKGPGRALLESAFARAVAVSGTGPVEVRVESDLPTSMGLGSSAALAVACARLLLGADSPEARSRARVLEVALAMEEQFHGTPSGIDHTVSALEAPILYRRNPSRTPTIKRLSVPRPLTLVVALVGSRSPTKKTVGALRERQARWPQRYQRLFRAIGETAREGAEALASGDLEALGDAMNVNQGLLAAAGLSSASLEEVIHLLRHHGALGAKLTGAGGDGGAVVGLFAGEQSSALAALRKAGVPAFVSEVGAVS